MYPDYLAHYGVKGMKWGVRKKLGQLLAPGSDKGRFGKRGAKRIQKYKDQGMSRSEAVRKVSRQTAIKRAVGTTAGIIGVGAITAARRSGMLSAQNILEKAKGIRVDEVGKYYDAGKDIIGKILRR